MRDNRSAAWRLVRPRGEESNFWRTASARRACQSSAIARRTIAFIIKLVPDIRRSGLAAGSERAGTRVPRYHRPDAARSWVSGKRIVLRVDRLGEVVQDDARIRRRDGRPVHMHRGRAAERLSPDAEEISDRIGACGVALDMNPTCRVVRVERLEAERADSNAGGNRDGPRA